MIGAGDPLGAEHATKPAGEHAELVGRLRRELVVPEELDQLVNGDRLPARRRESRKERAGLAAADCGEIVPLDDEGAEHPDAHGPHLARSVVGASA